MDTFIEALEVAYSKNEELSSFVELDVGKRRYVDEIENGIAFPVLLQTLKFESTDLVVGDKFSARIRYEFWSPGQLTVNFNFGGFHKREIVKGYKMNVKKHVDTVDDLAAVRRDAEQITNEFINDLWFEADKFRVKKMRLFYHITDEVVKHLLSIGYEEKDLEYYTDDLRMEAFVIIVKRQIPEYISFALYKGKDNNNGIRVKIKDKTVKEIPLKEFRIEDISELIKQV